ncbi:MAG: hypothetical protein H7301_08300 [Cryobacterium sp.]|nr:hypothetical protein [Oligoflexia bacterium]
MGLNKRNYQFAATVALLSVTGSGCGVLQGLISGKNLDSGISATARLSEAGATFKEVPYGAAVGTVIVPTFQTATAQVLDTLGMTMAQAGNVRTVNTAVSGNLPEVGVASNLSVQSVFAYSKLYIAACTDKCNLDRSGQAPAVADRLCNFDTNKPHGDSANAAAWEASLRKMGELFWGRAELTAEERSTLITLRDEVGAVAVERSNGNANAGTLPAFQAVCAAMAISPAALVQ